MANLEIAYVFMKFIVYCKPVVEYLITNYLKV